MATAAGSGAGSSTRIVPVASWRAGTGRTPAWNQRVALWRLTPLVLAHSMSVALEHLGLRQSPFATFVDYAVKR